MPHRLPALVLATSLFVAPEADAQTMPPGFERVTVANGLIRPIDIAFADDGLLFITVQAGEIRVVHMGNQMQPMPFIDLTDEINLSGERGLLGLALHPGFVPDSGPTSWVYLLYTVSPVFGQDLDFDEDDKYSFSRLTRYKAATVGNNILADPSTREVLIGNQLPDGSVPDAIASLHSSHSNGTLVFGEDGSLLITTGDGAHFEQDDFGGLDAPGFDDWVHPVTGLKGPTPALQDTGAYRSRDPRSLAGKVLRVDPATGGGYPSNPFFDGDPFSNTSRIWATGLRNPYRANLLAGTGVSDPAAGQPGTLLIADVGQSAWEELNLCEGGEDFGWPCRQGVNDMGSFVAHDPADPDFPDCGETLGGPLTDPLVAYHHVDPALSLPPGVYQDEDGTPLDGYIGYCIVGGDVYPGGGYPDEYDGRMFFIDHPLGWIQTIEFDASHNVVAVRPFATGFFTPVTMKAHPVTGDFYVVGLLGDSVSQIRYVDPGGAEVYGCTNPPGSLELASAGVVIGVAAEFLIDNPLGTQAPGSFTTIGLSAAPDAAYPCGSLLPGYGMQSFGAAGELLLSFDPAAVLSPIVGPPWTGSPTTVNVPVPYLLSLVGAEVFAQGLIYDPGGVDGSGPVFGLTEAVRILIGS